MDALSRRLFWLSPVAFALALAPLFFMALARADGANGATIAGRAVAIDGDTIEVAGERVRLEGIDAPESGQSCGPSGADAWACGKAARHALEVLLSAGPVKCEHRGLDKYGRVLGICYAGGLDINGEMVRSGLAWAFVKYSSSYVAEERAAKSARAGIWRSESEPAWIYRERRWTSAEQRAPAGCAIKGNVTDGGQIYHLPWSPWYEKVRIEPGKGERWFCSETQALSAGWRPAIVN